MNTIIILTPWARQWNRGAPLVCIMACITIYNGIRCMYGDRLRKTERERVMERDTVQGEEEAQVEGVGGNRQTHTYTHTNAQTQTQTRTQRQTQACLLIGTCVNSNIYTNSMTKTHLIIHIPGSSPYLHTVNMRSSRYGWWGAYIYPLHKMNHYLLNYVIDFLAVEDDIRMNFNGFDDFLII